MTKSSALSSKLYPNPIWKRSDSTGFSSLSLGLLWGGNMVMLVTQSLLRLGWVEWHTDPGAQAHGNVYPLLNLIAALHLHLRSTKQGSITVPPCSQEHSDNQYFKVHWALGFSGNWELGAIVWANIAPSCRNPFSFLSEWVIFVFGEVSNYHWTLSPW